MKNKLANALLVDDDASGNMLTKKIIQNTDLVENVSAVTSAEEALLWIDQNLNVGKMMPEIIFLDIHMPQMSGWDFIDTFTDRYKDRVTDCDVVLLTGSTQTGDLIRSAITPKIGLVINKPVTDFEVRQALENRLKKAVAA